MTIAPDQAACARRDFLKGAGILVIGFTLGPRVACAEGVKLGAYGPAVDEIDTWIAIDRDGIATLYTGICELGTGNNTAILQIMADELDVAFAHTRVVGPDTNRTPDQFVTSGSRSIAGHAVPIRQAAAEARAALVAKAATLLKAPIEQLRTEDGVVSVIDAPARKVTYAQLIGDKRFDLKITGKVKPKKPDQYRVVGTPVKRIDLPAKVAGSFTYVHDIKLPGMLHGRVVRPPSHGGSVVSIDEQSVNRIPGLVKVVRKADFIGVVCEREEQAIAAARSLQVTWSTWAELPQMKDLHATLRAAPVYTQGIPAKSPGGVIAQRGDTNAAFAGPAKTIAATYETPFHLHGSIGPSCALADVRADGVTVWTATQTPYGSREAIAKFLGLSNDKVRLIRAEGAGCYGQNGADDVAIDAVVMSQAVGRPVRVQWMRADEAGWETYKTARVSDLRAALNAEGKIVAWESTNWGFSGYSRPEFHEPHQGGEPGSLVSAQLAGWTEPGLEEGFNGVQLEIVPIYEIANKHVTFKYLGPTSHRQGPLRLRTGSMRGVGAPDNLFTVESFIDELAFAAQADPVAFRLRHLEDERAVAVLKAATERAGWKPRTERPTRGEICRGRGVSMYGEGLSTRVASVFDVEVNTKTGKISVPRVVVAIDCGLVINPDGLKNQVEGAVIQGISRVLMEEVTFDRSHVTSLDWARYPIITFDDVPESVEVVIINRPELPAMGAAEHGTKNVWAGVANAVFDATGVRLRRLPFRPESVKKALEQV